MRFSEGREGAWRSDRMCGLTGSGSRGAMGIGGKINRPRTELRKKLFKRRRELARGRRQKRRSAPPVPLWGKRRRKELKRLRAVTAGKRPEKEKETRTGNGGGGDVEMAEAAPQ